MIKKIVSLILIGCITISCAGLISADTNIVNSMNFQGEAIKLSLDDAIEVVLNDSISGKKIEWNKEKAEAAYWDLSEKSDAIHAGWNSASNANKAGLDSIAEKIQRSLEATRSDADVLEFTGEFYRTQRNRNYTAEQNTLRADVIDNYFGLVNLNDLVIINEDNVAVRQKLYDNTLTKFELGMVAKQDVLTAEYELMNAQTTYNESVANLKKAKMGFNLLLGFETMQEVVLTDTISENTELEDIAISDAVSKALTERNEVYAAQFQLDLQTMTMDSLEKKQTTVSQYKEQKIALEETKLQYPLTLQNVEMDVRGKYMDKNQKKDAMETSKKSVESLEEALRLLQLSYEAGLAVLTDVQEMQTKVFQAKTGLSNAILEYNLAVDEFDESMGAGRFVVPIS